MSNTQNDDQGKPGPLPGEVEGILYRLHSAETHADVELLRTRLATLRSENAALRSEMQTTLNRFSAASCAEVGRSKRQARIEALEWALKQRTTYRDEVEGIDDAAIEAELARLRAAGAK